MVREFWEADFLPTSFRMADFGSFFEAIATAEGWGEDATRMLGEMQDRQKSMAMGKSLVMGLLREMLTAAPLHQGRFHTAKEWASYLLQYIPDNDVEARRKMTPNYFGHCVYLMDAILKEEFHMEKEPDERDGHRYSFRLDKSPAGAWDSEEDEVFTACQDRLAAEAERSPAG